MSAKRVVRKEVLGGEAERNEAEGAASGTGEMGAASCGGGTESVVKVEAEKLKDALEVGERDALNQSVADLFLQRLARTLRDPKSGVNDVKTFYSLHLEQRNQGLTERKLDLLRKSGAGEGRGFSAAEVEEGVDVMLYGREAA
jgi:hypothetical protein